MSEDRSKKSWREIDQQRDKSSHRRDEPGGPRGFSSAPRRQRNYRAKLDHLFDSGKIGKVLEKQQPGETAPPSDENRLKLFRKVIDETGRDGITRAIDAYLAKYELSDDFDFLAKMLEHRQPSRQLEAMVRLDQLLDAQQPKRKAALTEQLQMIRDVSDETELVALARKLIDRL